MKKFLILFLFCISFSAFCQICWEENGMPVQYYANMNWSESATSLNDGSFMIAWSDESTMMPQTKAMKINCLGENIWQSPAILKENSALVPDDFNICQTNTGIVFAWFEYDQDYHICCQMLDQSGNRLWGNNGFSLNIDQAYSHLSEIWLIPDSEGGLFLNWSIQAELKEIYGIHFNSSGNITNGWNEEGNLLLLSTFENDLNVYPDNENGLIVISNDRYSIMLQRINADGDFLWGNSGIVRTYDTEFYQRTFHANSCGGYSLYFNSIVNFYADVFYEAIDEFGNFLFEEPQLIYDVPDQTDNISLAVSDDEALFISWSTGEYFLAQKILDQELLWGNTGCIVMDSHTAMKFHIVPDNYGGCYLLEYDYIFSDNLNIWCQHLNSQAETLFSDDCYSISCESEGSSKLKFCSGSNNIAGLFWQDLIDGEDIVKVQTISNTEGLLLEEAGEVILNFPSSLKNNYSFIACNDYSSMIWGDSVFGRSRMFAQILENDNGSQLFPNNPARIVCDDSLNYFPYDSAFDSFNELLYINFTAVSDDQDYNYYGIQALNMQGELIFGDCGLHLFPAAGIADFPYPVLRDTNDGILLLYMQEDHNYEEGFAWKLHKINENGLVWQNPITLCAASDEYPYYNWKNDFLAWECDENLRILKFDDYGNIDPLWNNSYIEQTSFGIIRNLELLPDNLGGCIMVWTADYTIMGQKFDETGSLCWEEDGRTLINPGGYTKKIHLADEYFYFTRYTGNPLMYYIDKYDYYGNSLWNNPIPLGLNENGSSPKIDVWNNFIIFYYHTADGFYNNIKMNVFDSDGESVLADYSICNQPGFQDINHCITNPDDSHIIFWNDAKFISPQNRANNEGYFAQKIDLHTLNENNNQIIKPLSIKNYPNPFSNETHFKLSDSFSRTHAKINIYNIKGQFIKSIDLNSGNPAWNGIDHLGNKAASAVYLYHLKTENNSVKGKMLLLPSHK